MTEATPESIPSLAPDINKAAADAFMTLVDKARSIPTSSAGVGNYQSFAPPPSHNQPKAWFTDPFALLDSVGMGYRNPPTYLTYETQRQVSERNDIVAAIIITRCNQAAAFARPQVNKYSVGFTVTPRLGDKKRRLTDGERDRVSEIQGIIMDTGRDHNLGRDSFDHYIRKTVRDSLTYDQIATEKVSTMSGSIHSFYAVPADTIRIAQPKITKGTPPALADAKREIKYLQLINAQIKNEYTLNEMMFGVRNPRTHVKVYGYGFSEIEQLIATVTSHLYAEEWNRRQFTQGSTVKGILNLKGPMPLQAFENFKRQWQAQVSGISNAWKTPVTNQEGIDWIPLQMNNVEMGYQMWMEYLVKIISAIYQIDPAEINFDLRGSSQQQPMFMSTNEAQQKVSKDRGLAPLLRFLEDSLNKHIVWKIDPRFELAFAGLDAKTEDQAMQLRIQQVQNFQTLNEVRALEDLPPLKDGNVPLNATYTAYLMQKSQMDQQQQMMQQQGGAAGSAQQPGAGPGGEEDPNQEPYASRFGNKPPSDEEEEGANNLNRFLQRSVQPNDKSSDDSSDDADSSEVSESEMESLHINDWDSSKHAAVNLGDLKKSRSKKQVKLFDTMDV